MFKLKKVADLKRNYIISTNKLKVTHWSILS
ncbi:cell division protein FtsK, partial [Streptococcus pneumoniae]